MRIKGHRLVSIGTNGHNFSSSPRGFPPGDCHRRQCLDCHAQSPIRRKHPSDGEIKVTRDLIRARQLLKLELLDHVIIGNGNFSSLRALGHFAV